MPTKKRKTGRPTKRDAKRDAMILKSLRAGNTRRAACAQAGISEETLRRWLDEDSELEGLVKQAEALAEAAFVDVIRKAAEGRRVKVVKVKQVPTQDGIVTVREETTKTEFDWRAAAYWLGKRCRKEFGGGTNDAPEDEQESVITEVLVQIATRTSTRPIVSAKPEPNPA